MAAGLSVLRVNGTRADCKFFITCSNFGRKILLSSSSNTLTIEVVSGDSVFCHVTVIGEVKSKRQSNNAEIFPSFTPIQNFTVGSTRVQNVSGDSTCSCVLCFNSFPRLLLQ